MSGFKFTKCSVEFKFLATVLTYCLAVAAGAHESGCHAVDGN